jgi:hypothetical protein
MRSFLPVFALLFVPPLAFVSLGTGCQPTSLIGQPCTEAGEELCEAEARIRCDGKFYVLLAECSHECIGDLDVVTHDEGVIDGDETWQCLDGPHYVASTLTVAAGSTLKIEAGSLVKIELAARITADPAGRVEALGSAEAPILVTSNNGKSAGFGAGAEGGINVFAVTEGEPSRIEHTIIERGIHGLGVFGLAAQATPPVVENNTLRDNENYGILITCNEADPPIPDFAGAGNEFFNNGEADVSPCSP